MGSASITMPAPPPNGLSSVVRWASSVNSRRFAVRTSSKPRSRAIRIMPRSSTAAKYSGKMVSRSTRMTEEGLAGAPALGLAIDVQEPVGKPHVQSCGSGIPAENGPGMIGDQDLPRLSPHHEHFMGAGGHDALDAPEHRTALLDHLEPDELVVVDLALARVGKRGSLDLEPQPAQLVDALGIVHAGEAHQEIGRVGARAFDQGIAHADAVLAHQAHASDPCQVGRAEPRAAHHHFALDAVRLDHAANADGAHSKTSSVARKPCLRAAVWTTARSERMVRPSPPMMRPGSW